MHWSASRAGRPGERDRGEQGDALLFLPNLWNFTADRTAWRGNSLFPRLDFSKIGDLVMGSFLLITIITRFRYISPTRHLSPFRGGILLISQERPAGLIMLRSSLISTYILDIQTGVESINLLVLHIQYTIENKLLLLVSRIKLMLWHGTLGCDFVFMAFTKSISLWIFYP